MNREEGNQMEKIRVGIIGSQFSANIHANAYCHVRNIPVEIVAVAGKDTANTQEFAQKYAIPHIYQDYQDLIDNEQVDVVDVCVPNFLHADVIIAAARKGIRNIVCEKPLTGSFGKCIKDFSSPAAFAEDAFSTAMRTVDQVLTTVRECGVKLMYAENWVYAPPIMKAKRLLTVSGGTILDMRAEESHSGSHASYTKRLDTAGGGAMLVLGSHPVSAVIHMKAFESQLKGLTKVRVRSVMADMTQLPRFGRGKEQTDYLVTDWVDVETWGNAVLTFDDGTKAVVNVSFAVLGGVKNILDIYSTNSVIKCNMTPNDTLTVYAPDPGIFQGEYLAEKQETTAGWSNINADEDWMRGYPQEMQDFMECIYEGREPISDGFLARDAIEVIYAAYVSSTTGRRVDLH